MFMHAHGISEKSVAVDRWVQDWNEHYRNVTEYLPSDRLLILDIEKEPIEKIDKFLGIQGPPPKVRHVGYTPSKAHKWVRASVPLPVRQLVPKKVRRHVGLMLRKRR
jgi:hypothetical protein